MDFDQTQALPLDDYFDSEEEETTEEKNPVAHLKVLSQKGLPERLFPLHKGINIIGRYENCDIYIPEKALSKEHACIEIKGENHLIFDKNSRNKTRKGKLFLTPEVHYNLEDGQELVFADIHCVYMIVDKDKITADSDLLETLPLPSLIKPDLHFMTNVDPGENDDESSNASSDLLGEAAEVYKGDLMESKDNKMARVPKKKDDATKLSEDNSDETDIEDEKNLEESELLNKDNSIFFQPTQAFFEQDTLRIAETPSPVELDGNDSTPENLCDTLPIVECVSETAKKQTSKLSRKGGFEMKAKLANVLDHNFNIPESPENMTNLPVNNFSKTFEKELKKDLEKSLNEEDWVNAETQAYSTEDDLFDDPENGKNINSNKKNTKLVKFSPFHDMESDKQMSENSECDMPCTLAYGHENNMKASAISESEFKSIGTNNISNKHWEKIETDSGSLLPGTLAHNLILQKSDSENKCINEDEGYSDLPCTMAYNYNFETEKKIDEVKTLPILSEKQKIQPVEPTVAYDMELGDSSDKDDPCVNQDSESVTIEKQKKGKRTTNEPADADEVFGKTYSKKGRTKTKLKSNGKQNAESICPDSINELNFKVNESVSVESSTSRNKSSVQLATAVNIETSISIENQKRPLRGKRSITTRNSDNIVQPEVENKSSNINENSVTSKRKTSISSKKQNIKISSAASNDAVELAECSPVQVKGKLSLKSSRGNKSENDNLEPDTRTSKRNKLTSLNTEQISKGESPRKLDEPQNNLNSVISEEIEKDTTSPIKINNHLAKGKKKVKISFADDISVNKNEKSESVFDKKSISEIPNIESCEISQTSISQDVNDNKSSKTRKGSVKGKKNVEPLAQTICEEEQLPKRSSRRASSLLNSKSISLETVISKLAGRFTEKEENEKEIKTTSKQKNSSNKNDLSNTSKRKHDQSFKNDTSEKLNIIMENMDSQHEENKQKINFELSSDILENNETSTRKSLRRQTLQKKPSETVTSQKKSLQAEKYLTDAPINENESKSTRSLSKRLKKEDTVNVENKLTIGDKNPKNKRISKKQFGENSLLVLSMLPDQNHEPLKAKITTTPTKLNKTLAKNDKNEFTSRTPQKQLNAKESKLTRSPSNSTSSSLTDTSNPEGRRSRRNKKNDLGSESNLNGHSEKQVATTFVWTDNLANENGSKRSLSKRLKKGEPSIVENKSTTEDKTPNKRGSKKCEDDVFLASLPSAQSRKPSKEEISKTAPNKLVVADSLAVEKEESKTSSRSLSKKLKKEDEKETTTETINPNNKRSSKKQLEETALLVSSISAQTEKPFKEDETLTPQKGNEFLSKGNKKNVVPTTPALRKRLHSKESTPSHSPSNSRRSSVSETSNPGGKSRRKNQNDNEKDKEQPISQAKKAKMSPQTPLRSLSKNSLAGTPELRHRQDFKPKVMFTGLVDKAGEKIVKDLGGELIDSVQECTHLVTDKVRRTCKFLCIIARGKPIVTPTWLEKCKAAKKFIDSDPFTVRDLAAEKQYKFVLAKSLKKANENLALAGYSIFVTANVKPEPNQMKDIIECAGGKVLLRMPKDNADKVLIISCEEDKKTCVSALNTNIPVVNAEFILTGMLQQEINIEAFKIFTEDSQNSTSQKGKTSAAGRQQTRKQK